VGEGDHAEETHCRQDHQLASERQPPDRHLSGRREKRERQADDDRERKGGCRESDELAEQIRRPRPGLGEHQLEHLVVELPDHAHDDEGRDQEPGATAEQGCDNRRLDAGRFDECDLLQEGRGRDGDQQEYADEP
jgi:hypothetical protein